MDAPSGSPISHRPTVALALGGGAARGIAHIAMLEAFDELGIRPKIIAGCSIGAIMGACYAAGLSAKDIRAHIGPLVKSRRAVLGHVLWRKPSKLAKLWSFASPRIVDGPTAFELLLPDQVDTDFAKLPIPLRVATTDYYSMDPVVLDKGPVIPAVAASASLPSYMLPVEINGRYLYDGGFANPTPFDLIQDEADITVAIDVSASPDPSKPVAEISKEELWDGAFFSLFAAVVREKAARRPPDILLKPKVGLYRTMDFGRMDEILAVSAPEKERLKKFLTERVLGSAVPQGTSSTT